MVAFFVTGWNHAQPWLQGSSEMPRRMVFAALMGAGAISLMLLSVQLQPGVIVDLRSSLIAISGFFGGPMAAVITGGMAAIVRLYLGGHGAVAGLVEVGLAT